MVYAIQDGFSTEIAELGTPRRVVDPAHITYTWYPNLSRADLGIGPTGVYWIHGIAARDVRPGSRARIEAVSSALPNPPVRVVRHVSAEVPGDPTPDVVVTQAWLVGDAPALGEELALHLANVGRLAVDLRRARITSGTVKVATDGPTTLRLGGLRPGTAISWSGGGTAAGPNGTATVTLQNGLSPLRIG